MRAPTEILFPGLHTTKTGHRNYHGNSAAPVKGRVVLVVRCSSIECLPIPLDVLALKGQWLSVCASINETGLTYYYSSFNLRFLHVTLASKAEQIGKTFPVAYSTNEGFSFKRNCSPTSLN